VNAPARPGPRREATEARLAALALPPGGGWLDRARQAALQRLAEMGLPLRRDEYWRFTDPAALNAPGAAPSPAAGRGGGEAAVAARDGGGATFAAPEDVAAAAFAAPEDVPAAAFAAAGALRLVFVDGRFDAAASDPLALDGVAIERLAEAAGREGHWAQGLFGALEAEGQSPIARPFAALNTAFAPDGVLIRATGRTARPVHIVHRQRAPTSDAILHHVVRVEPGASLTLLESGPAAARGNQLLELDIAEGAELHHLRDQGREPGGVAATATFARLAARAELRSFTLTLNGRLTRNEAVVWLCGDDARAHLAGAVLACGDVHHDDTVFVAHDALRCESRQVFKKVLLGGAVGVFQGKILVRPGAQRTDGYQLSRGLLLDERAQFLAKPELEIYADDVKCSHGSTAGGLDEAALFYLRSRGVPHPEARDLLSLAFLAEAVDEIADPALAADITGRLEGWLARRR
jgi:Fe-S cluster assembly protein SufD